MLVVIIFICSVVIISFNTNSYIIKESYGITSNYVDRCFPTRKESSSNRGSHDYEHEVDEFDEVDSPSGLGMEGWIAVGVGLVAAAVLCVLIARCCRGRGSRGRVLAPPSSNTAGPAPYPQQQFAAPYGAAVAGAPPAAAGYYPHTQYIAHAPVVAGGAAPSVFPQQYYLYAAAPAVAPFPAGAGMPGSAFPGTAPYPTHDHFPLPQPAGATDSFTRIAPPGWSAQACPPSYDQAMCGKQPPYNPHAPH